LIGLLYPGRDDLVDRPGAVRLGFATGGAY
jgi:hypothetical protein